MPDAPANKAKYKARLETTVAQTRWYRERRADPYFRKAKKDGYRSRSAFKLKQINNKWRVVRPGDAVADLGCAPGGWSQVLVEMVGPEGLVVGVDLQRTRPIDGARLLQGDFTQAETRDRVSAVLAEAGRSELDAVVSDMAPDMSGNYDLDQVRSVHLATLALEFADKHLRQGGFLVCKVFEGADFQDFREEVRKRFRAVHSVHPPASRKQSSEVFVVGMKYQGVPDEAGAGADGDDPYAHDAEE